MDNFIVLGKNVDYALGKVQINTPKCYVMIYRDSNGIEHFYWTPSY